MTRLSFPALARFYLPLALSGLLMTLQQPVVAAALARTANPGESLAAYGLALSIAVLLESPIQALLAAGAALAHDEPSFRTLQRFTAGIGTTLVGLGALLVFTPLGLVLFRSVLNVPPAVSAQALLALKVLLPWSLLVAWRRLYQGVLIGQGQTRAVSYGTAERLIIITIAVFLAVSLSEWPGAVIGAGALLAGALFEALFVVLWLRKSVKGLENVSTEPVTFSRLGRFYWPLSLASLLTVLSWPLVNAGIGRATAPEQSLAAWSVTLSLLWLFTTPLQMLQQMTITQVKDTSNLRTVRWFAFGLGGTASGLLGVLTFTPLLNIILLYILAMPAEIASAVVAAGRWLVPFPFLSAAQAFYQGLAIDREQTTAVRSAMIANLLTLCSILVIGVRQGDTSGFLLAAVALVAGLLVEVAFLLRQASRLGLLRSTDREAELITYSLV